jgi:5-methylcytosine-specific restriction endonuclease McrA
LKGPLVDEIEVKIRCQGCLTWRTKEGCVSHGLGWCCDDTCKWTAVKRVQQRVEGQRKAIKDRGYVIPKTSARQGTKPGVSTAKRRYIRQRDGEQCRYCGTSATLHVHHVRYRSEGGGHEEENLLTLCLRCHDRVHSNKKHWQPILIELLRLHYEENRFLHVADVERMMA